MRKWWKWIKRKGWKKASNKQTKWREPSQQEREQFFSEDVPTNLQRYTYSFPLTKTTKVDKRR